MRTYNLAKLIKNRTGLIIPLLLAVVLLVPVHMLVTEQIVPRITIIEFEPFRYEPVPVMQGQAMVMPEYDKPEESENFQYAEPVYVEPESEEILEIAISLNVDKAAELAVNSTVDADGNSIITFSDISNDEVKFNMFYTDGNIYIEASALDMPGLEGYEYIVIDAEHEIAQQIRAGTATGINDDKSVPDSTAYHADSDLSDRVWDLIESVLDVAVRDDDLSWLLDDYWDFGETPLFYLYDFPNLYAPFGDAFKASTLLSGWASHQQHLLSYIIFDCEELKHRLVYFCICEEIAINAVIEAFDWLWADENEEIRMLYRQVYTDQKLLAFNMLMNRGIVSRDFTRAMYHLFNNDHVTNRRIAEKIIEVVEREWSEELMEAIAEELGIEKIDLTGANSRYNDFG